MRLSRFRPSPAMVVACLALLVALGGGSYAAITLPRNSVGTRQVKDFSLLRRDFRRGQVPRGAEGPQGPQGPRGVQGISGPAGPVTGDLPSGATLRGAYGAGHYGSSAAAADSDPAAISFGLRLSAAPVAHFIPAGSTPPAACPGTAAAPEAQAGHLCIYEQSQENRTASVLDPTTNASGAASRYGAIVLTTPAVAGAFHSRGTWAVTAP